eukprot:gene21410-28368_t
MSAPFITRRPRFILFGDSLTQLSFDSEGGWGAGLQHAFFRKVDVLNRGFSGYNTRWILNTLDHVFEGASRDNTLLVTVFLGANDAAKPDGPEPSVRASDVDFMFAAAGCLEIGSFLLDPALSEPCMAPVGKHIVCVLEGLLHQNEILNTKLVGTETCPGQQPLVRLPEKQCAVPQWTSYGCRMVFQLGALSSARTHYGPLQGRYGGLKRHGGGAWQGKHSLAPVEHCLIIGASYHRRSISFSSYSHTGSHVSGRDGLFVRLKLQRCDPEVPAQKQSGARKKAPSVPKANPPLRPLPFIAIVDYHLDAECEFLIERTKYMQVIDKWWVGQRFRTFYADVEDPTTGEFFEGKIISKTQRHPTDPFRSSTWEQFAVEWDNSGDDEEEEYRLSAWEMLPPEPAENVIELLSEDSDAVVANAERTRPRRVLRLNARGIVSPPPPALPTALGPLRPAVPAPARAPVRAPVPAYTLAVQRARNARPNAPGPGRGRGQERGRGRRGASERGADPPAPRAMPQRSNSDEGVNRRIRLARSGSASQALSRSSSSSEAEDAEDSPGSHDNTTVTEDCDSDDQLLSYRRDRLASAHVSAMQQRIPHLGTQPHLADHADPRPCDQQPTSANLTPPSVSGDSDVDDQPLSQRRNHLASAHASGMQQRITLPGTQPHLVDHAVPPPCDRPAALANPSQLDATGPLGSCPVLTPQARHLAGDEICCCCLDRDKSGDTASAMIGCAGVCAGAWHLHCLKPAERDAAASAASSSAPWLCPGCTSGMSECIVCGITGLTGRMVCTLAQHLSVPVAFVPSATLYSAARPSCTSGMSECAVCGITGSTGRMVHPCSASVGASGRCGLSYHVQCLLGLAPSLKFTIHSQKDGSNVVRVSHEDVVSGNISIQCPAHFCQSCHGGKGSGLIDAKGAEVPLKRCWLCPRAFHSSPSHDMPLVQGSTGSGNCAAAPVATATATAPVP